jgi:hypothetical protein
MCATTAMARLLEINPRYAAKVARRGTFAHQTSRGLSQETLIQPRESHASGIR